MKTKKALSKRIKITASKKILKRQLLTLSMKALTLFIKELKIYLLKKPRRFTKKRLI